MLTDLGDPWTGSVQITNADGALENAGAVTVTITQPDGAVVTPDPTVTNPYPGVYETVWTPSQLGRHTVLWEATGENACAVTDTFTVGGVDTIVSVEDLAAYMGNTAVGQQESLRSVLVAVSELCELTTRRTWRRTLVVGEVHDGGRDVIRLRKTPVASVSQVRVDGVAVTDWVLTAQSGLLYRGSAHATYPWACGIGSVEVDYTAGPADGMVPGNIVEGCYELAAFMWDPRRGGSNLPRRAGAEDAIDPTVSILPLRVRQLWRVGSRQLVR